MLRILPPPWDFRMMTSSQASGGRDVSEAFCVDKYESIRKLAMVPQQQRNPNKPFTSFRINDILSSESEDLSTQKSHKSSAKQSQHTSNPISNGHHRHSPTKPSNSHNKHHRSQHVKTLNHHRHIETNGNNRVPSTPTRIVRPWDASPSPGKNSEASSEADEEEINVDDDEDVTPSGPSAVSLKDVSPLDALMEMANKTFQGLETSEAAGKKTEISNCVKYTKTCRTCNFHNKKRHI